MAKQLKVPQNTPKSDDVKKNRSTSKFSSAASTDRLRKNGKTRKRNSYGSNNSAQLSASAKSILAHCSCERLQNELFQFISDFVTSQEYQDYLDFKKNIIQKDEEVQYDINDLVEEVVDAELPKKREVDVLRALSRRALRVFFLDVQIEKYLEGLRNEEILKKQQEAIDTIRQKIADVKAVFLCHNESKLALRKAREQQLIQNFISRYNIDISKMITTERLDRVILDVQKKLMMKRRGHKNNTRSIIERLVKEYNHNKKRDKKIKRVNVEQKAKVFCKETIMHIKGRKGSNIMLSSLHFVHKEDAIIRAFREAGVCLKEEKDEIPRNLWDKACFTDVPYTTKDKGLQESSMKNISFQIPQENNMFKIILDENAKEKLGTMESFVEFEDLLEARHFFCTCEKERKEKEEAEINFADDLSMTSTPSQIDFKEYKTDKVYNKRLVLRNTSGNPVRIRFFRFYFDDVKYTLLFEVVPDEMRIARPGLPVDLTIKFRAPKDSVAILGKLVFLTCCKSTYYRYVIPIKCTSAISDVTIEPRSISFGTIPLWKFLKNSLELSKSVKVYLFGNTEIRCSGKYAHKLIIKKVRDPLELESKRNEDIVSEDSSSSEEWIVVKKTPIQLQMEQIIKEILRDIDCRFRFDKRFLVVQEQSGEEDLKISVSRIEHSGFYFEKYSVDIYKMIEDAEEYKGTQDIVLSLEVADHFIRCDPVCVDFGICFYGAAYQTSFSVINNSKTKQFMSVRIPSLLNYYVSLDENSLVLKPEETRKVTIKLLPSNDLMSEKCKYFDQDTSILYFPIEVKLTDKKYAPVPPTIEHCYAIVNDCSDLTLDPQREHYEMCDGQMVLDVGQISVIEAVTTKIVLRNSSYSKRYYGFLDLPRYISIMPNCGFGSINAFQEITLDLFFHPQVDDFRVATSNENKYRQNKNITIRVETIANLGKYRRKPNLNRLLKLMKPMLEEMDTWSDIDLLESIFAAKSDIRAEFDLCTCSSALLLKSPSKKLSVLEENEELNKNESAEDSDVKQQESSTKIGHHHKKKKKMSTADLSKQHSDEDNFSMKKSSSAESSMKRKRSRMKSISEPEINLTVEDRQPSLLDKKAIQPLLNKITPVIPTVSLLNLAETLSRKLRLNMAFVKPLYEFSFNYLEFPVTPGGSYSMMMTELRPLKKSEKSDSCGIGVEGKKPKFRSTFRIAGSTEEVRVEPMYGVLEDGESIKLTVVATPKMNEDVVAAYVLEEKKNALYQEKMEEELRKREDNLTHKKVKKSKTKVTAKSKGKKKKISSIDIEITKMTKEPEEDIQIEISSKDVEVEYPDLYPAELALWRSIEPYFLNTNFVCRIDYEMEEPWTHEPDIISLETVCKVISPDFIHDQKVQRLDFGQVPIGDCKRKIVTIQNLRYHDITVSTNILRPEGGFFCPYFDSVKLPSECYLKIPITYTPTYNESVLEYMDIKAERTVYQFLLMAEAATPNVRLDPSSKVLRVVVKRGKYSEVSFEVVNDSLQAVKVSLEKVCELEGRIINLPSEGESKSRSNAFLRKKAKNKKDDGNETSGLSPKKNIRSGFSDELTEEEIFSIENEFSVKKGSPYFQLMEEDKCLTIPESSKKTFKIGFGPTSSESPRSETHLKKKDRKKTAVEVNDEDIGKTFVAKFNLLIGSSSFLRDFIILGEIK